MPKVLTQAAIVGCAHGGKVQPRASQSSLTIRGQAVLVEGDFLSAPVSGCTTVASPNSKPCTLVTAMTVGACLKVKANGKAVLLDTAKGTTDGLPAAPVMWSVQDAGQTEVDAT